MKSGYNSIHQEEGELKPLTNISGSGESRIKKKHLVLVSLGLVIMGFLMGHLMNTQHSGHHTNKESMMAAQVVDFKELVDSKEDVSTCIPPT